MHKTRRNVRRGIRNVWYSTTTLFCVFHFLFFDSHTWPPPRTRSWPLGFFFTRRRRLEHARLRGIALCSRILVSTAVLGIGCGVRGVPDLTAEGMVLRTFCSGPRLRLQPMFPPLPPLPLLPPLPPPLSWLLKDALVRDSSHWTVHTEASSSTSENKSLGHCTQHIFTSIKTSKINFSTSISILKQIRVFSRTRHFATEAHTATRIKTRELDFPWVLRHWSEFEYFQSTTFGYCSLHTTTRKFYWKSRRRNRLSCQYYYFRSYMI